MEIRSEGPAVDCWCRLESEAGVVRRVHVMHPNGEILSSYPPATFSSDLLARMRIGQIRGRVASDADTGAKRIELVDAAGQVVFTDALGSSG